MPGIELPNLVQRLVLDASGFKRGAAEATSAFDTVSRGADSHATKTNASWLKSSQGLHDLGKAGLVVGAGLAAAFGASVAAAVGFEREMRNVSSISGAVQGDFKRISDQVLELSKTVPQSAKNLAAGLYDIVSSGKDGAEAMVVLEASAKAASAGMTTTAVAAKGVSAVLNAYGMSGFEAAKVSDILFQTVNKGVLTFEELASNLGDFVGTAAILHVPIEDAAAALAAMTLSGINAAEASTALNRVFLSFIKPSEDMSALLHKVGFESGSAAIEALGLKGAMELLGRETGGNVEAMQALFPEVRGLKGTLALLANEGQNYNSVASAITSETERMGATQKAFNEQSKSFSFQLELAKNNLTALGIEIGQRILPVLSTLLSSVTGLVTFFSDLPGPVKVVATVLGLVTAAVGVLGGAFLLLAPRILAAQEAMSRMAVSAPGVAGAIGTAGKALGLIGLAFSVATIAAGIYASSQKEAKEQVEEFRVAIERERQGLEGATEAAIKARLVNDNLVGTAAKLGISYDTLTKAVQGNADAMARVQGGGKDIIGTIGQQTGAMGGLNKQLDAGEVGAIDFASAILRMREAVATATQKVKEQEERTGLLMQVTGKTKKELIDLGLATETMGDKIEAAAASIGLTGKTFAEMGVDSEEGAKAFAKSVTAVMEATQKAFMKDFDVVAQFSAAGWDRMKKDAESAAGAIVTAEEKLADARQNLVDVHERLNAKTTRSVSDNQALAKAEEKVREAVDGVTEARAKGSDALGTMSEEIAAFYKTSLAEAETFNVNVAKAIEMGLDPTIVTRLLQEGPKQAAPLLQEIVSGHGTALVKLMNASEEALAKSGQVAVETARLTQLAVSSKSGQMVIDLKNAMKIAQLEAASGGKATIDTLATAMNLKYQEVKDIVDEFGIVVPSALTAAGKSGAEGFTKGIAAMAPSAEALVRAVDSSFKDFIGPLPPYVTERAAQIASMWKLGTDPMPSDTQAVMYLLDSKIRGVLEALPGFTHETGDKLASFWRTGLDPMPGDTKARAEGTATMLHNALDPLPGAARETSLATVTAWLTELAKGTDGTSEQTAAWAQAMLSILNPMLNSVGSGPIQLGGSSNVTGDTDRGIGYAAGGIGERHDAMISTPGSPTRVWSEPETQGEAYIPLAPSKRRRSEGILGDVAGRFGFGLVPMAYGGVLDDLGLPLSPTLGEWGYGVGHTAETDDRYAYDKVRDWVQKENERKAAEAAKVGGAPYTGGDIGSGYQQILGYLDSKGVPYEVTSTTGGQHAEGSYHYQGKAVDLVGDMGAIFGTLAADNPVPGINELFWDPAGYYFDNGSRVEGAIGDHEDHVHAATFDKGGLLMPGYTLAYNGTGQPELVARMADGGTWMRPSVESDYQSFDAYASGDPQAPTWPASYRDEWVSNSQNDPNAGRPGYIQSEDGSWVPDSFYGGRPGNYGTAGPNGTRQTELNAYGQLEDIYYTPGSTITQPAANTGPKTNFTPTQSIRVPPTPTPGGGGGSADAHEGSGGGFADFDYPAFARALADELRVHGGEELRGIAQDITRSAVEAAAANPLHAYVVADEVEAAVYANGRGRNG